MPIIKKLDERKTLHLKYGKLPLKPGFNKRKLDFKEKMDLLDIEMYGSQHGDVQRSRSVDPFSKAKYRRLNNTTVDVDNAANQIIENSLNQYRNEVVKEEEVKQREKEERDYLESMYDDIGGSVFNINH